MSRKVMVAMSGGVDSSAAALLLKQSGYDIGGMTLSLYCDGEFAPSEDAADAKRVCEALGAEHYLFDMREDFRRCVIDRFAEGYRIGETPNPCVECNRSIKFSGVLQRAEKLGYDLIATGHYVISEYDAAAQRWILRRACDPAKDQSYVLYVLSQHTLSKTLFPLGGLNKAEIRELAEQSGLATARKRESQDICFVPDGDYGEFLVSTLGLEAKHGSFVDTDGKILGEHHGHIRYTIGQRRGLGVSSDRRIFVLSKDIVNNRIVLGDEELLFERRMTVRDVNWVSVKAPDMPIKAQVKARYRQSAQPAWIFPGENGVTVEFDRPQRALTPGQAAVFYDGDVVLGGGTICANEQGGEKL